MQIDPKEVALCPAGHLAQEWQIRTPVSVGYADLFDRSTWLEIEKAMRSRGGKHPRKHDLLRVLGSTFDVVCRIDEVSEGYNLTYYSGIKPAPLPLILADLDALQVGDAAELKARADNLQRRWRAMGATRDDISAARRSFAKDHHPDVNETSGQHLAVVNATVDAVLANMQEAA